MMASRLGLTRTAAHEAAGDALKDLVNRLESGLKIGGPKPGYEPRTKLVRWLAEALHQ